MDGFQHLLYVVLDFFRDGFERVNAILGLLIAIYSAYRMTDWKRLWAAALGAVLIHIIATILVPVIDHDAPFRLLPLVDIGFWQTVLALYLGYIIAIAAFFYVKTNVLQSGGAHASSH